MRMGAGSAVSIALATLCVSAPASAQYRDLDAALAGLERGFAGGDVDAIVSGIGADQSVLLEFPGLAEPSGMFGRDQAAYLLDGLFHKVEPNGFVRQGVKADRARGENLITGRWTFADGARDLLITLRHGQGRWTVVAVRSSGR